MLLGDRKKTFMVSIYGYLVLVVSFCGS